MTMTAATDFSPRLHELETRFFIKDLHDPTGSERYRRVPFSAVSDEARTVASMTARICSADLGIEPPRIEWFRAASEFELKSLPGGRTWRYSHEMFGWAHRELPLILVRCDQPLTSIAETVAHETAHVSETKKDKALGAAWNERRAEQYGLSFRAWHESGTKLHYFDGFPVAWQTLAGEADYHDLLIAEGPRGDDLALYTNAGTKQRPEWKRWRAF
jgi:hypothetical protein